MSQETSIEWTHFPGYTGATWNPVTGCTKIAQGCAHCYAETIAKRFWKDRKFTDVQTHPERLDAPLRRRKPTCYFVNSMSDLFHDDVPFEFIAAVYGVMAACPQHLFIILTKRVKRMREFHTEWLTDPAGIGRPYRLAHGRKSLMLCGLKALRAMNGGKLPPVENGPTSFDNAIDAASWPLPNVIHGYSAANQADLDAGVGDLLATPSALRCLSLEPLIGPIDLTNCKCGTGYHDVLRGEGWDPSALHAPQLGVRNDWSGRPHIDWVLVGGESGPGARPCDIAWIRSIVEQCKAAGARCFVKQVGSNPTPIRPMRLAAYSATTGKPLKGWYGDGHETIQDRKGADPAEWPQDINVREYPEVARG